MRREVTTTALAFAGLVFLAILLTQASEEETSWLPYPPPAKPWLLIADGAHIKNYDLSTDWLTWEPRANPWWEPDERMSGDLEVSALVCMLKTPQSPERIC